MRGEELEWELMKIQSGNGECVGGEVWWGSGLGLEVGCEGYGFYWGEGYHGFLTADKNCPQYYACLIYPTEWWFLEFLCKYKII